MENINTFDETLSDEVRAFYAWNPPRSGKLTETCLDPSDGLLHWSAINARMRLDETNQEEVLSHYELCLERIPEFFGILDEINGQSLPEHELIQKYSAWSGRTDEIWLLMNETSSRMVALEQVLLLSSILEFSLGNIFCAKRELNPPHLFKDLLKSPEINEVFRDGIPFIRYVLGTPVSVNLRNIAWHGFLNLNYSLEVFPKLLLWIVLSLGRDLALVGDLEVIQRPFSVSAIKKFDLIRQNCGHLLTMESPSSPENDPCLLHLSRLLKNGQYGRSLQLLLLQIESHMRRLYSRANQTFDTRARIDGYYFTLDVILDQNVCVGSESFDETSKTQFRDLLSDSTLSLFYDCFVSLKGPRIRDRMSHGELRLTDVTKEVVEVVTHLYTELVFIGTESNPYDSYFHPISELIRKVTELGSGVRQLRDLQIPEDLQTAQEDFSLPCTCGINVRPIQVLRDLDFIQISKFARTLCQIIENCIDAIRNYTEALTKRLTEFLEKSLSQPRRKTLIKMLEIRWKVIEGIDSCSKIVEDYCRDMQTIKRNTKERPKMIKEILKIVENLKVQLSVEKNDWKRASEGVSRLVLLSEKSLK